MKHKFNVKKKLVFLGGLLAVQLTNIFAQQAPNGVCTFPDQYVFDQEVTYYFDLSGNEMVSPGDSLFFYSWTPNPMPGGPALLSYVSDMTWSLTTVPTDLYGVTKQALIDAGNTAFWSTLRNSAGTSVTGTLPYSIKEALRNGSLCSCVGDPSLVDNEFFVNFGASTISGEDVNGNHWTNVNSGSATAQVIDQNGVYRFDIETDGSFLGNNNSEFTLPDPNLLGELAVAEMTTSYLYIKSCEGSILLNCLDPNHEYTITILGSRNTTASRETKYKVIGASALEGIIQTSGYQLGTLSDLHTNDDDLFTSTLFPASDGVIEIQVGIESGGYAYINGMLIQENVAPTIVPVTGLTIDENSVITNGPSRLTVDYWPSNTTQQSVFWSVSDQSTALIDDFGLLRPLKEGSVTVSATSGFDGSIMNSKIITFQDLSTHLFLGGTGSEAQSDHVSNAIEMRRVYDADSSYTAQFEIYTSLESGHYNFFDNSSEIGGDGNGNLLPGDGNEINVTSPGWYHIVVDLAQGTYSTTSIQGWNVVSHMLPLEAHQVGWWGGDEPLATYEGNGVWSAYVNFSEKTPASQSPRLYFTPIGSSRKLKQVDDSKNKLMFEDQVSSCGAGGLKATNIMHFNGEYKVILDMHNFTFDFEKECNSQDENRLVYLGSSVCKGYGADPALDDPSKYQGYAYQYAELLEQRFAGGEGGDFNTVNVSIGGNSTQDVLNRMDRNLYTECGKYVMIGLSMANEGLLSGGISTFYQFEENMMKIIDTIRAHNMVPIINGNYANASYGPEEYDLIKQMNILIHQWDVPSTNLLGALEDRNGKFLDAYISDPWHPNTNGYSEFFYALVPSLIDALATEKPIPVKAQGNYLNINKDLNNVVVEFTPENIVHSFTLSFDIKTEGEGVIASFNVAGQGHTLEVDQFGELVYTSSLSNGIVTNVVLNDQSWHDVSLTHYHALGQTILYIDGQFQGMVEEQLIPELIRLSDEFGPSADYRDLFFHRSAMNEDEIAALHAGAMLKSSLGIYAPLDQTGTSGLLVNLAQSLNTIDTIMYPTNNVLLEAEEYFLAMDAQVMPSSDGGEMVTQYDAGEWMVWKATLPVSGNYRVEFRVSTTDADKVIRFEEAGAEVIYGFVDLPNSNGEWVTVSMDVTLNQGFQYLAIWSGTGGFDINWINIVPLESSARSSDLSTMDSWIVSPNPVTDVLQVSGSRQLIKVDIIDASGVVRISSSDRFVPVYGLESGYYFSRIHTDAGVEVTPFIKQ